MVQTIIILILTTIGAGASYFILNLKSNTFKTPLVFAGAYLFSITVIHILPELFSESRVPYKVGVFVLVGFLLQHILEFFTSGVEHGHMHQNTHHHGHKPMLSISLLIALCIHALLEGALLSHPSSIHAKHESHTILFGIVLHKMPAAFALMSVLSTQIINRFWLFGLLTIFAIMTPLGLLLSNYINMDEESTSYLFALVSGSFLHISTTIFVESNPGHRTDIRKLIALFLGVFSAIIVESI